MRNTGGTDHEAFDAVDIPGFQFIQEPLDYGSRTHHSNMDTYERLQPADMAQAATVEAIFVYNAAMRDQMLPRKPLPHPELQEERAAPLRGVMPGAVEAVQKSVPEAESRRRSNENRRTRRAQRRLDPAVLLFSVV
jgi:Zn-dependent M28 family amino/carboxypeptidase